MFKNTYTPPVRLAGLPRLCFMEIWFCFAIHGVGSWQISSRNCW